MLLPTPRSIKVMALLAFSKRVFLACNQKDDKAFVFLCVPPTISLLVVVMCHFETGSFVSAFDVESFVGFGAVENRLQSSR